MTATSPSLEWLRFVAAAEALDAVLECAPNEDERLPQLMRSLDGLALAFQGLTMLSLEEAEASPASTYGARAEQIRKAFPELGGYWSVRPEWNEEEPRPGLSDAVDDLADILSDVDRARWLADHQEWRQGMWEARFTWEHHAGAHLVDLRGHLYRLIWFGH